VIQYNIHYEEEYEDLCSIGMLNENRFSVLKKR